MRGFAAVGLAALVLTGCQSVQSDVTRFHQLPAKGDGTTVFIAPVNEPLTQTMEFRSYAAMVTDRLRAAGYKPTVSFKDATFVALLDYGVVGHTKETGTLPIYGQTGGGISTFSGQAGPVFGQQQQFSGTVYTPPTYGVTGTIPYSRDIFHRHLQMSIYRFDRADPKRSLQVFDGVVSSSGQSETFNQVAGCLVEALFKDFPGRSGATERVAVDLDKCRP